MKENAHADNFDGFEQGRATELSRGVDLNAHQRLLATGRPVLHHGQDHGGRDGVVHGHHGAVVFFVQFLDPAGGEEEASSAGVGARESGKKAGYDVMLPRDG